MKYMKRNDNISAFGADEYDREIRRTLPYYDEFYKTVIDVVKAYKTGAVNGLTSAAAPAKWRNRHLNRRILKSLYYATVRIK